MKLTFLQGWPVKNPDVIVSTPASLLNYLYAIDPEKRRRSDFTRGVKYVVLLSEPFLFHLMITEEVQ